MPLLLTQMTSARSGKFAWDIKHVIRAVLTDCGEGGIGRAAAPERITGYASRFYCRRARYAGFLFRSREALAIARE